jgi:hypothetical protein
MGDDIRATATCANHFSPVTRGDFDVVDRVSFRDVANGHDVAYFTVCFAGSEFDFLPNRGSLGCYHKDFFVVLHSDFSDRSASTGVMKKVLHGSFGVPVIRVMDVSSVFV